jgi:hypothetical protein
MAKLVYEVECGAIVIGDESDAEKASSRCYIHNKRETIVRVQLSEWLSNCHNCSWRRWYGNDEILARDESRRHWLRNASHKTSTQPRRRRAAIDAELALKKRIAEMGLMWYNGRVRLPQKSPTELEDIPPF